MWVCFMNMIPAAFLKQLTATFYLIISHLLFHFLFLQLVVRKFVFHRILSFLCKITELWASFQPPSVVVGIEWTCVDFCCEALWELIICYLLYLF